MQPPQVEEEENAQDADHHLSGEDLGKATPVSEQKDRPDSQPKPQDSQVDENEENKEEEESKFKPDVIENDFLEKAGMSPPQDPDGQNTLLPDLCLTKE